VHGVVEGGQRRRWITPSEAADVGVTQQVAQLVCRQADQQRAPARPRQREQGLDVGVPQLHGSPPVQVDLR
jgi:hypothetical protein